MSAGGRSYRWTPDGLVEIHRSEHDDATATIVVADSWLVRDGTVLALPLHRDRFLAAIPPKVSSRLDAPAFWTAATAVLPRTGAWFPRVQLEVIEDAFSLVLQLRPAPALSRAVTVASAPGTDVRTNPTTKGPDLARMRDLRSAVRPFGAEEAIVSTEDGYVVEGSYSGLLWWRGNIICGPPADLLRVDSVTSRSVLGLATALGIDTFEEAVTPAELADTELWSLNSLHGIRIVRRWIDGPALAELPGRLSSWRARLEALRKPL